MMNQQYELLRERNDPLKELSGKTYNAKTKFEAEQILKEIHSVSKDRMIDKNALCYILKEDEIKGVGGSTLLQNKKTGEIESNLIMDNFGFWLSSIYRRRTTATGPNPTLTDNANIGQAVRGYGASVHFNESNRSLGSRLAVGSGVTAPTRTDFNIETRFATAPEMNDFFPASDPVYNATNGNFSIVGSITAGGTGTVNEGMEFQRYQATSASDFIFAMFRDIISPGQPFVISDTISLEYTVQI